MPGQQGRYLSAMVSLVIEEMSDQQPGRFGAGRLGHPAVPGEVAFQPHPSVFRKRHKSVHSSTGYIAPSIVHVPVKSLVHPGNQLLPLRDILFDA
jgi:hypothetical protein